MNKLLFSLCFFLFTGWVGAQEAAGQKINATPLIALIDSYTLARENKDTLLLKRILTADVDQLVSSGVWRTGWDNAKEGMLQSSENNPGTRRLIVEKVRILSPTSGIVDARYVITQTDGTERRMWSTFIVVLEGGQWKISAIRNMLPTSEQ
jgi:hypothetical protein